MPFELEFKLFLGDLRFEYEQFDLIIENNNKKIYEINFNDHLKIKEIYDDYDMENDYSYQYNEFVIKMEDFLESIDYSNVFIAELNVEFDFSKYSLNKTVIMIITE